MRLPDPVHHWSTTLQAGVLRAALALPEPVQRRLAGAPVVRDGLRLDTETQLLLALDRLSPEPPVERQPVPDGRRSLRAQARAVGGRQPIGSVRDLLAGTDAGDLPVRLYTPRALLGREEPAPLLVFLHGGAWVYGDLDSHDAVCRFLAERAGVLVLAVDYRLAPEVPFPGAARDAVAAYRWVLDHTDLLGADRDRLAVGGDSAGGCLAATTAIEAARRGWPLRFQVLVYPATDMTGSRPSRQTFAEGFFLTREFMDMGSRAYLPDPASRTDPEASPLLAELPPGLAPAYVVTAGFDPLRDEGEEYAGRLAAAGVEVELRRFSGLVHSFFNVVGVGLSARTAVAEIADRLAAGLR